MLANKLEGAAAAAVPAYVEDVFSTYLYNGTGSSQTITNGIDLSGKGGMVWIKNRSGATSHVLHNTVTNSYMSSDTTGSSGSSSGIVSSSSTGFDISVSSSSFNASGSIYTSWTFRKQAKFFDVVTYTGNGSNRTITHNLGSIPGCIIVKRTDTTGAWQVYHRSLTNTEYLVLNSTAAKATGTTRWNSTTPTSTEFSLGTDATVNANGGTYVAYLFAHNAGGFGASGSDNVISCGSFTTSAVGDATVDLGWEPQFVIFKASSTTGGWSMFDNVRGFANGAVSPAAELVANTTDAETVYTVPRITSTGFNYIGGVISETFVYIAIRRGPMKTPTDSTKVFTPTVYTGTNADNRLINTTIAPDMVMIRQRNDTVVPGLYTGARLTGDEYLITGSTNAGATDANSFDQQIVSAVEYGNAFSSMSGVWVGNDATRKFNANTTSNNHIIHAFKRAPGFFDVVCFDAPSSGSKTISHNLGVVPELIIHKRRATAEAWWVYSATTGADNYLRLNTNAASTAATGMWPNITSSSWDATSGLNVTGSGGAYVAYLFASLAGVSKVGSYTGNGTNQVIDCGFTAGARYVLIKRTDTTGNWLVYDTARGITTGGSDPQLGLNITTAEQTTKDVLDADNSGFKLLNSDQNTNVLNATYIYLAIA